MRPFGWTGKILHIDLTTGCQESVEPPEDWYAGLLGGRGLAGRYLRLQGNKAWDAPDMGLLVFAGPLAGTRAPGAAMATLQCRSPLTGTLADSCVGGRLGAELKRAGWDGLRITGRAPARRGLEITDGTVRITDAAHLAGLRTNTLVRTLGWQGALLTTGPAADAGVRFACLSVDGCFSAGRGGLGLCFAAKNLAYLAVRGTGEVRVKDPEALEDARAKILRQTAASPALLGEYGFGNYGTAALYDLTHSRRMMPTDNFRRTRFEAAPGFNAVVCRRRFGSQAAGCPDCHIRCLRVGADNAPMPGVEPLSHFTALLENTDLDLAVAAYHRCCELGMDSISAAATLACHAEIRGRALAGDEILELLDAIAAGKDSDAGLAAGSLAYAMEQGRPEASMSVKGLELPCFDPRGAYGMALGYALSTRGGCHLRATAFAHEILRKPVATDRFTFSGKARVIKTSEDTNAAADAMGVCKFLFLASGLEEYAQALQAVTGLEVTAQDLLRIGERIYLNERCLNQLYGLDAASDDLPQRFFSEPGSGGDGIDMPPLDREKFLEARRTYYTIRGLDAEGKVLAAKALELGVEPVA